MLNKKMIQNVFYGYILAAGVLWGTIGLFFNHLSDLGLDRFQIMLLRVGIAAICLGIYIAVTNRQLFQIDLRDWWMFFGTGICSLMFFNYCYFTCIAMVSVSVAAVLLYTAPMMVMVMSIILFHEKFTAKKGIVVLMTFAGCVLVTGLSSGNSIGAAGILVGLGAGFGYALYSIFSTYALRKYHSITITFYTFVLATLGTIPLSHVTELAPMLTNPSVIVNSIGLGVFACLFPYLLYTRGLTGVVASHASVMATVEPVVATIIGAVVFHETMTTSKVSGIILILAGIIVLNVTAKKPLQKNQGQSELQ